MSAFNKTLSMLVIGFCLMLGSCSAGGGSDSNSDSDSGSDAGSDSSDDTGDAGTPPPANASSLRVTTFNTGLLPLFVPSTDERVGPVVSAVTAHDADVLCLQEVWRAADQQSLAASLQSTYPSIFIPPTRQKFASSVPVCTEGDLEPVVSCALSQCLSGSGISACLIGPCHDAVETLAANKPECAQAISAQAGKSALDILEIQDELLGSSGPARLFSFDGSSGLILASRIPLEQVQVVDFFDITTTSRRAGILATVTKNGIRHRVGCTHLQSNLDGVEPYTGTSGSWGGEQLAQADRFIAAADSYSGTDPQYLAGDFNCSRANSSTNVASDLGATCSRFLGAGYSDPAAQQIGCTFCSTNLLNVQNDIKIGVSDTLLDHVFTKNVIYSGANVQRVFTETISISAAPANLSDHFGVKLSQPVP